MEHHLEGNCLTLFLEGRITAANAPDISDEMMSLIAETQPASVVLDASKLEYISSAGLRAIINLRKSVGEVAVREVSPDVYEVFDMTGLTEILSVERARRRISVEGCTVIGRGAEGTVYRLDPETIVKVCREGSDPSTIAGEKQRAQAAFLQGIPTAISYDLVDVDGCVGIVYELLDADNLEDLVDRDAGRRDELIARYARFLRECHKIELDPAKFENNKLRTLGALDYLEGAVCTPEELAKLKAIVANIPDSHRFSHGDAHVGNVMMQGDEMLFIDMTQVGMGHPIFDLMSMFLMFKFDAERQMATKSLTLEDSHHVWDVFLRSYLDTDDEELLAKAEGQIMAFACTRTLLAAVFVPGAVPPEAIEAMKGAALASYDRGLEPLCF